MIVFVARRLMTAIPTAALISLLVFLMQALLPGDAALVMAGDDRSPEAIAHVRAVHGLDDPAPLRYLSWAAKTLSGDFGTSIRTGMPVGDLVLSKLPATLQLTALALGLAIVLGIPGGILAAVRRGEGADRAVTGLAVAALSVPHFLLGILLILLLAVRLQWLPASGFASFAEDPSANLRALAMPALVLGLGGAAVLARHTRAAMIEVLSSEFIRTARAKGLSERAVVFRHALRHAMPPSVTMIALIGAELLGGVALTEQVFSIPGVGKLLVDAVFTRDYPVVQALVLWTGLAVVAMNLTADVVQALLNPRLREG